MGECDRITLVYSRNYHKLLINHTLTKLKKKNYQTKEKRKEMSVKDKGGREKRGPEALQSPAWLPRSPMWAGGEPQSKAESCRGPHGPAPVHPLPGPPHAMCLVVSWEPPGQGGAHAGELCRRSQSFGRCHQKQAESTHLVQVSRTLPASLWTRQLRPAPRAVPGEGLSCEP